MRPLPIDFARSYFLRGWMPIPVPYRSKNPGFEGWQNFTVTEADLPRHFGGTQLNIGVRLGKASGDLADVDLDCAEARTLALHFLPTTGAIFGRLTSPRSHWLYVAPVPSKKTFIDPITGKRLVEILTNGQQAIFPGSTHKDTGEPIEWYEEGEPARVSESHLIRAAGHLAAAVLFARNWPEEGSRQDAALALAGGLLRAGWGENEAAHFIGKVCETAGDEEARARVRTVSYTRRKLEAGERAFGWPRLTEIIDQRIVNRACEWLEIHSRAPGQYAAQGTEAGTKGKGESAPRQPSRFKFSTLDELLSEPEEDVAYVWEKTLPRGGFSICAAKPKVGKSTLARNLAVAISRGADFFGRATVKGKVIYLCLEEKRAEVARHFRLMGASGPDIIIYTGRTPDDALGALEAAIEEHAPSLIIIDPLSRFVRVSDFNSYGEVTRGLEPLIDLARASECQCHIMAVHHNGKGEREGGDALLGSTGFFGAVDTLLTMKRREQARTLCTVQRYGEDIPETVAHLDAETGIVTAGGDLAAIQLEERKRAVLEAVGDESLTEADIKERVGGNQTLTAKALRALCDGGALHRTGGGKRNDPYFYFNPAAAPKKDRPESSILDSVDIGNPENRENRESDEPAWLMSDDKEQGGEWLAGEPDEVRERAAIMEIDGLVPGADAQRLARAWFAATSGEHGPGNFQSAA